MFFDAIAISSLTTAMFLWGSSFIALKLAFQQYDPMFVIFARMALASVCFLPFLLRYRQSFPARKDLKYFLLMALCEPCLYFLFEAKALENTTASQAGMITAMLPLLVAVSARFFLKEHITGRTLTGFALAIAGAAWLSVSGESSESAPNPPLGNFLEFLAMVSATGYIIILKRLTRNYSPLYLTAVQAVIGSLFYFPFLFLPSTTLPTHVDPVSAISVVYLGTAVTMGAYGLYNFGVSRLPASQASAFVNLIPVFTVVLGWLILGERFSAPQYVASIAIFAGIFLSQSANGKERLPKAALPV